MQTEKNVSDFSLILQLVEERQILDPEECLIWMYQLSGDKNNTPPPVVKTENLSEQVNYY